MKLENLVLWMGDVKTLNDTTGRQYEQRTTRYTLETTGTLTDAIDRFKKMLVKQPWRPAGAVYFSATETRAGYRVKGYPIREKT